MNEQIRIIFCLIHHRSLHQQRAVSAQSVDSANSASRQLQLSHSARTRHPVNPSNPTFLRSIAVEVTSL